jgi:hypothetical protein
MGQDLDDELIPIMQQLLRLLCKPDTGRRARDDERARLQRRALGDEAHNLRDGEDEVPSIVSIYSPLISTQ